MDDPFFAAASNLDKLLDEFEENEADDHRVGRDMTIVFVTNYSVTFSFESLQFIVCHEGVIPETAMYVLCS